jgi:hypothetical protein
MNISSEVHTPWIYCFHSPANIHNRVRGSPEDRTPYMEHQWEFRISCYEFIINMQLLCSLVAVRWTD